VTGFATRKNARAEYNEYFNFNPSDLTAIYTFAHGKSNGGRCWWRRNRYRRISVYVCSCLCLSSEDSANTPSYCSCSAGRGPWRSASLALRINARPWTHAHDYRHHG
jgi:hypothetical protein